MPCRYEGEGGSGSPCQALIPGKEPAGPHKDLKNHEKQGARKFHLAGASLWQMRHETSNFRLKRLNCDRNVKEFAIVHRNVNFQTPKWVFFEKV